MNAADLERHAARLATITPPPERRARSVAAGPSADHRVVRCTRCGDPMTTAAPDDGDDAHLCTACDLEVLGEPTWADLQPVRLLPESPRMERWLETKSEQRRPLAP